MEYFTTNGRRIRIIGQYYCNGSVKFTGLPVFWGSSQNYISNATIPDTNRGFGCTVTDINRTSSSAIGSWSITIDNSPENSPRSPVRYRVVRSRNRNAFLHCRHLERLWCLYNPSSDGFIRLIFRDNTRLLRRNPCNVVPDRNDIA